MLLFGIAITRVLSQVQNRCIFLSEIHTTACRLLWTSHTWYTILVFVMVQILPRGVLNVDRARSLLEGEAFFDYDIETALEDTLWAQWQYERHHVIEQYNLQSLSLWSYEQCHEGQGPTCLLNESIDSKIHTWWSSARAAHKHVIQLLSQLNIIAIVDAIGVTISYIRVDPTTSVASEGHQMRIEPWP